MSTQQKSTRPAAKGAPVKAARRSTIGANPLDSYDPLGHIPTADEIRDLEASRDVARSSVPRPASVPESPAKRARSERAQKQTAPPLQTASKASAERVAATIPAAMLDQDPVEVRQLSARVPADLVQRLKIAVAVAGVSQQDALVEAVEMWIGAKSKGAR